MIMKTGETKALSFTMKAMAVVKAYKYMMSFLNNLINTTKLHYQSSGQVSSKKAQIN